MNYDIEWLFEKIYKIKSKNPDISLNFLSDWDCYTNSETVFSELIADLFEDAKKNVHKYHYSFEQFELKSLISETMQARYNLQIDRDNFTISPSATTSIYLCIKAIEKMGYKRGLLFTPAYFSLYKNLDISNIEIVYFHLLTENNYAINFEDVEKIIKEQEIDCLFLTDPIYSTGCSVTNELYRELLNLCNEYSILLVIDHSLGGLDWNIPHPTLMPFNKLKILKNFQKYIFIDSLPKRLFINGVKASLIFGSKEEIDKIDLEAEGVYGALNSIQVHLLKRVFNQDAYVILTSRIQSTMKQIENNYRLISKLLNYDYKINHPNSGFFVYALHEKKKIHEVNTMKYAEKLLEDNNIVVLTNDRLGSYKENNFGFRINLCQPYENISHSIIQCCRMSLDRFHNA